MKKILVLYFSRTGFTNGIAEKIAHACHADIEPIKIEHNFGNQHAIVADRYQWQKNGYLQSMYEALTHATPNIDQLKSNLDDYDLIIIGTPIWFWNMASPIRSFLTQNKLDQKQLALFCTYGGGGAAKVFHDIEKMLKKKSVAHAAFTDTEILKNQCEEKITNFVSQISFGKQLTGNISATA
jgi:flavodoxin